MRVELGDQVRTVEGNDAGAVKHLILDPNTGTVQSIVIEKGFLFFDDVEVPLSCLQTNENNVLFLSCSEEQLKELPHFHRDNYTEASAPMVPMMISNPNGTFLWPNTTPFPNSVAGIGVYPPMPSPLIDVEAESIVEHRSAGEESEEGHEEKHNGVVIDAGSHVVTMDGEKVGKVHDIAFDAVSGRPMWLIVRSGFLIKMDTELPGETIASVDNGTVYLNITKDDFDSRGHKPDVVAA
jgi:sporulation protein YlmC with PRC-barrel domain